MWASCMPFNKTTKLMRDELPINATRNPANVRNHLYKIAKQRELILEGKPLCISGCANEGTRLPKPSKPMTIGIDGGYKIHVHSLQ